MMRIDYAGQSWPVEVAIDAFHFVRIEGRFLDNLDRAGGRVEALFDDGHCEERWLSDLEGRWHSIIAIKPGASSMRVGYCPNCETGVVSVSWAHKKTEGGTVFTGRFGDCDLCGPDWSYE